MNSHQNSGEKDMDLKEGLDRLGQRYGQLQQDEPPELLDLAVLNSAHRAVEKKPHWMKFSWLHGLTTAAVFVLAFTLILNQSEIPTVFENGMKNNEPVSLQREMVAKKQSLETRSDNGLSVIKEKSEARQEALQSMPAAIVAESPALESARDEEYLMTDSTEAGAIDQLNLPGQYPEPAKSDAAERAETDSDAEQKLLEIIKLKQSGDEAWKAALETFREIYPDHPLPDELTR